MRNIEAGNVMVVDGGGRGEAVTRKLEESPAVKNIFAVPGHDLMKDNATKPVETFPQYKTTDVGAITEICEAKKVELVFIEQDDAIAVGLGNALRNIGVLVVGPTKEAGQIEWDKGWARDFGVRHGLNQPNYNVFYSFKEAKKFLEEQEDRKRYYKAAFLAGGKGAESAENNKDGLKVLRRLLKDLPEATKKLLIEDWITNDDGSPGEEFSAFAIIAGEDYQIKGYAQDNKRRFNFDQGPQTGGMSCVSPPLVVTPEIEKDVESIFDKAAKGLYAERRPYQGPLYLGGMRIIERGVPVVKIVEFNARDGDPEEEGVLPGIKNDWYEVGVRIGQGDIKGLVIKNDGKVRVVIAGVARGYPGKEPDATGKRIHGLEDVRKRSGVTLIGAGVKKEGDKYYAVGNKRLFYIVAEGNDVVEARERGYGAMSVISIEDNNLDFRDDTGFRDVQRLRQRRR